DRLTDLGSLHASLGISAENFETMEEALIDTLKYQLGEGFSPELEMVWRKAYADISSKMIREGGIS
ncbi:MAG: globin, partial [Woeseiaceae bacterium]